ncbi:MAG: FHA domain-containing protein [Patescibacteria group bacterium]
MEVRIPKLQSEGLRKELALKEARVRVRRPDKEYKERIKNILAGREKVSDSPEQEQPSENQVSEWLDGLIADREGTKNNSAAKFITKEIKRIQEVFKNPPEHFIYGESISFFCSDQDESYVKSLKEYLENSQGKPASVNISKVEATDIKDIVQQYQFQITLPLPAKKAEEEPEAVPEEEQAEPIEVNSMEELMAALEKLAQDNPKFQASLQEIVGKLNSLDYEVREFAEGSAYISLGFTTDNDVGAEKLIGVLGALKSESKISFVILGAIEGNTRQISIQVPKEWVVRPTDEEAVKPELKPEESRHNEIIEYKDGKIILPKGEGRWMLSSKAVDDHKVDGVIVIGEDVISRAHADLSKNADGQLTVTDLGSRNGTWVNNEKLTPNKPHAVKDEDILIFANIKFFVKHGILHRIQEIQRKKDEPEREAGEDAALHFPIDFSSRDEVAIGRAANSDVNLTEADFYKSISRQHAKIVKILNNGETQFLIKDNDSLNGSKVNGLTVGENGSFIKNDDVLTLGRTSFRVNISGDFVTLSHIATNEHTQSPEKFGELTPA